jgi:hypothetical protein
MNAEFYERLRERFRRVFDSNWERGELSNFDELREKFAFHMADAATNLAGFAEAYRESANCDDACLQERMELFFVDCLPHLIAAAQIYDEIPQIFPEQQGVHDWSGLREDEVAN